MATTALTMITAPRSAAVTGAARVASASAASHVRSSTCRNSRTMDRTVDPSIGVYRRSAMSAGLCSPTRGGSTSRAGRDPRTARPNYLARRVGALVLLALAALALMMAANGLLASLGAEPASAAEASPAFNSAGAAPATHVARPGDTLWSIAHTYRGEVDHDPYVRALIRLNGGATVQAGQTVLLP